MYLKDLLSEEELEIKRLCRKFADREIMPKRLELEEDGNLVAKILQDITHMGVLKMGYPKELGGEKSEKAPFYLTIVAEEFSRADAGLAMAVGQASGRHLGPAIAVKNKAVLDRFVPIYTGDKFAYSCLAMTEPDGGCDVENFDMQFRTIRTIAKLDGDGWVINGSKNFISNAGTDMTIGTVITAVTDVVEGKNKISAIFVPKDTPGFTISPNLDKVGWNHADTRNLYFQDVRVPKENLIGTRGQGFKQFLNVLNIARITVGVTALGLAQQCLNESLKYSKERTQFGQPISKFQLIQAKLADMATEIEAARQLMHYTAWLVENGKRYVKEASMFKYFVSEVGRRAANQAVQIHGGYGYSDEYDVERYMRNARGAIIYEGSSEIQTLIQAGYASGERQDKPLRREMPAYDPTTWQES